MKGIDYLILGVALFIIALTGIPAWWSVVVGFAGGWFIGGSIGLLLAYKNTK